MNGDLHPGVPGMRVASLFGLVLLGASAIKQAAPVQPRDMERRVMHAVARSAGPALERELLPRVSGARVDPSALLGLGLLRAYALDREAAESRFARLEQHPGLTEVWKSWAAYYRASSLAARGRLAEADTLLQQNLTRAKSAGDRQLEARLATALANVRIVLGPLASAEGLLASADSVLTPTDSLERALVLCTRAALAFRTGRGEGAPLALNGWELARAVGDYRTSASCRQRKAMILERRGFFDNALDDLRRGIEDARRVNAVDIIANAGQFRGFVLSRWGAFGEATEAYNEAIAAARTARDARAESWSLLGLGWVAAFAGDFERAVSLRDQAVAVFTPIPDRAGLANAMELRAMIARRSGDLAAASRYFIEARDMYQAMGFRTQLHGIYRELAVIEQERSDWSAANGWLDEATRIAAETRVQNWAVDRLFHDAVSALGKREHQRADSLLTAYLSGAKDSLYMTGQAWLRKAEARLALRDVAGAEQAILRGDRSLDLWRERLSLTALRLAAFQMEQTMGSASDRLPILVAQLARAGRFDAAFTVAEQRRGRELHDRLMRSEAVAGSSIATARWKARRSAASPLDPSAVLSSLGDSTAMLHYVGGGGGERSLVLVLARGVRRIVELPPLDSLRGDVDRFVSLVSSGSPVPAAARQLTQLLVDGAVALLPSDVRRLVIVPDGPLHRLPFDALQLSSGEWLVQRFAVTVAPSARLATSTGARSSLGNPGLVAAFGDPVFAAPSTRDSAVTRGSPVRDGERGGALTRLPHSGDEARRVGAFGAGSLVRLRRDASEAAVKRSIPRRLSVLHLATHAFVDDRAIGRSEVALSAGGGEDGFLTSAEIAALDLDVDLVILSACRTAGGVIFAGEGVQGLTHPFFEAGARAVIATQWAIGDASTVPFVERFYAALASGRNVSDALRQTKLDAIRAGVPVNQWAAFVLTGDGSVRPAVRQSARAPTPWKVNAR
jgi:CHAT domain-containing protein/tetratricopeptide (TPR) repeat protein